MSKILYIGPVRDFSGYATAARGYVQALHDAGADLVVRPVRYDQADPGSMYQVTELERELLKRDLNDVDVVIQHLTPNEMRPVSGKVNIAVVAWETTRIPPYWADKLNQFDAVITFCEASVEAFKSSGVNVPIHKVPHTFDIARYSLEGVEPLAAPSDPDLLKGKFVFYNISQFSAKKGLDVLLRSYLGAFHGERKNDVMLILKTYIGMTSRSEEGRRLAQYIDSIKQGMRLPHDDYPPVMLIASTLSEERMKKLHRVGDCYVCSSRGEGWCIPAFDALAYGNKLVTTLWGGMGEFCKAYDDPEWDGSAWVPEQNVYAVKYSLEPLVGQQHADPELYTSFDKVAEPSVSSMMNAMHRAYEDRDVDSSPPDLMKFDHSCVGPKMLQVINEIVAAKTKEVSNV